MEAEHEAQLTDIHRRKELLWKREQHVLQASVTADRGGTGSGFSGVILYMHLFKR